MKDCEARIAVLEAALERIASFEPDTTVDVPPHTQIAIFAKKTARAASGMEARSGETEGLDPKDDSPAPKADAQPPVYDSDSDSGALMDEPE